MSGETDRQFATLAQEYLDDQGRRHPDTATELGDHRFDTHLPDRSAAALADERQALGRWAAALERIDPATLSAEHQVDAAMMANHVAAQIFALDEIAEPAWNPLLANPGRALYQLLARDFAPLPDRLAAAAGRLAEVPATLAAARDQLGPMPRVHLETAITQFSGTITLITTVLDSALRDGAAGAGAGASAGAGQAELSAVSRDLAGVRAAALDALTGHRAWLADRLAGTPDGGFADPRLGAGRFARKLSLALNTQADADAILTRAVADLDRVSEEISAVAADITGTKAPGRAGATAAGGDPVVRQVLDRLAADAPDDLTILAFGRQALAQQTAFVADHQLVTVLDDPVEVIEMPEIDRGVAVAYCDPPGPLEPAPGPTFIAVSPTPADWPAERVASFYREYNRHMVHNLMVHEAMPGHYLQLQHSRRFRGSDTSIRAALWSGSFVEGWAVYAEQLMADHGYPGEGDPRAVRMQQLKMQLRMIINAILDARVHGQGMTEAEAMALMTGRGYQEEGEAAGKWRRALLTSAQLSTYYVGYTEVADLADELRAARPDRPLRELHDEMLAHGSPPVRLLRSVAS
ncbi:MAG: DUF885 domain-containing protein [Actinobacteria bacterium]|nr:DUF885 domain-containing protein [Actinomycetota bacterium]